MSEQVDIPDEARDAIDAMYDVDLYSPIARFTPEETT